MLVQKTHRKDPIPFPKIDAVSTFQLLCGRTKRISNQYPNVTRVGSGAIRIYGGIRFPRLICQVILIIILKGNFQLKNFFLLEIFYLHL